MFTKLANYFKETRLEMRKVNWPTRAETLRYTVTVILVSLGVAAVLGFFDFIFTSILQSFI
ncbi:preprotein translocase subunit SecE [Candidatus Giovannonibacteria bacterium RIFCSPLOWO2_01_FULL_43_160]|uniref:Protein translocase subunit SecE n=1 Tax=Candidatus Giovannonibacteria bacterium RIFCSPLOWO2_12_FULL_43_26 TaxID=1798363 RepID=A0A1F5XYE3_9BACT|nr:MAG: preprotein translocase subunit SecE [Candidatus Giovannonibacteria bacterium RIFCSPHIGHO2_01_FULL_43_140]OGF70562.1 MAG: preprotein translocase subunit SecE [Candidatus Giovannonibacteria bacterium RIFCSPHIGHO2_02_FULL_44_51]OGF72303.1 MAG: preprotein translocase subunit SecE [Candidatus Giovannonibacteria bacterium RIFCSPHIGHO2_12_FULL_44_22]OGF76582.1 MAG: preprotein translocase subunit SecE [Candidatus Giovannonibacteria bacterium RIFCSPLOWO2_01_FULL_43_160]OGF86181.1 MAG: preprotein